MRSLYDIFLLMIQPKIGYRHGQNWVGLPISTGSITSKLGVLLTHTQRENIMLRSTVLAATACLSILGALAVPAVADKSQGWSDISAGTAMAYCLAKHTGVKAGPDGYSADGFEVATSGIVGSIRRNFVFDRSKPSTMSEMNIGQDQTCEQACNQLGQIYNYGEAPLTGSALRYRPEGSPEQPSGIGDHVQLAMHDWEVDKRVVSGFWSRLQDYQTQDGGAVDHCCCQAVEAKQTAE